MKILVEIAPGELIDKLTILEIKLEQITDEAKLANIAREHEILKNAYEAAIVEDEALLDLRSKLKAINHRLWNIEDEIRAEERAGGFGSSFISLARSVYRTNDQRAEIKRQINSLLHSAIPEEKSYASY
jgi:hypothetical protein